MGILLISIPLISSIIIYIFGSLIGRKGSKWITGITIIINIILSIKLLDNNFIRNNENIIKIFIKEWINSGIIKTNIEIILSKEGILMINLINILTGIIIFYSFYYMKDEYNLNKFLLYLLLFSVSMSFLVLSNNFLSLFIGWEAVGIMSFLLINFWNTSLNNNKSAFKAILYNKIGDIFFILGLILIYNYINNSNINSPFYSINLNDSSLFSFLFFCFLIAALAKSAQFIFHCWLSDAMAGPTPVSSLLHSATMVTAGVYLLIKININMYIENIFNKNLIIIISILTILFSSFNSIFNKDIKKIIAFSTCSQIGLMILNFGFSNNLGSEFSSLFHLFTHGFFKALLFLVSGIIIHNLLNEQDLRKYGSLIYKLPFSYILCLIGTLVLISTPYLSGYYSKERILFNSYFNNNISIFIIILSSAILTIFYSLNLLFKTFIQTNSFSSLYFFNSKNYPEIFINKYSNYFYYILFFILISFSLSIGFFSQSFFSSPFFNSFSSFFNYSEIPLIYHKIPLYGIYIIISYNIGLLIFPNLINYIYFKYLKYLFILRHFSIYFTKKGFIDPIINYFFVSSFFNFSFKSIFLIIEKGWLEFLGPLGLFRLFYYFPLNYNIENHKNSVSSLTYIFLLYSITFILILPSLFLSSF